MIPEETIDEIKRRVDVGQVIGRYVTLKKRGRNYVGLCPFHSEKSPSFNVHIDDGFYKCFGCGESGDVISFLEKHTGQAFIDVIRGLAGEVGVEIPEQKLSPQEQKRRETQDRLRRILELTQTYFRQRLGHAEEGRLARAYLQEARGLEADVIEQFGLGFGGARDNGLCDYLSHEGVPLDDALAAGVVRQGHSGPYDFFRQRITFPIRDRRGRVIAFAGRAFGPSAEGRPKYVNSPGSEVYDKSSVLYGFSDALPALKAGKPAVLVEGQLDVIATHRAGFPTGVAPCGTALTPRQVSEIARVSKAVVLCLDADAAGQAAADKAILLCLRAGLDVSLCELLEKDPDSMVQAGERDRLRERLEGARSALEILLEKAVERSAGSMNARIRALHDLLPYLAAIESDALTKRQIIKRVARAFHEEEADLAHEVEHLGRPALQKRLRGTDGPPPSPPRPGPGPAPRPQVDDEPPPMPPAPRGQPSRQPPRPPVRWTPAETGLAKALLCHPSLAPRCGVLLEVMRNVELKRFVEDLLDALVRYHDEEPRKVLLRIPAPAAIAGVFRDIYFQSGLDQPDRYLTEGAAAELIEDYVETLERRPLERRLREVQRAIEASTERGDRDAARALLETQHALVQMLSRSGQEEPAALPAGARPELRLLEPAGFGDEEDPPTVNLRASGLDDADDDDLVAAIAGDAPPRTIDMPAPRRRLDTEETRKQLVITPDDPAAKPKEPSRGAPGWDPEDPGPDPETGGLDEDEEFLW